ncbi:glutamate transport system substrate-binding protein [Nonomuraea dietziae]|uniref:Glutamate transport system substrate-binding protein n=2 Tax=Nonomuraea dietziae TaxID=65515 RepID=A0A7W5YEG0_9ACTN|nr:glutamate transport system substrate-binding protein [Nonomuraea dietziae]
MTGMRSNRFAAPFVMGLVACLTALLATGGCGAGEASSIVGKETLVIGVRPDLPALGLRTGDGRFEGFDVDVATYVAGKLGATARFVPALAADREKLLLSGQADLVLATFSITQERKTRVAFAGPYHLSYQDILVREGTSGIANVRDLKGRRICEVQGSNAAQRVVDERRIDASVVPVATYDECMSMLKSGRIDAITTNDVILAGLAARERGGVRLVNTQFNEQRTGVGMRRGDVEGCERVNRAITDMYQDGTAARLLGKWFGRSGLTLGKVTVPQFEGCS